MTPATNSSEHLIGVRCSSEFSHSSSNAHAFRIQQCEGQMTTSRGAYARRIRGKDPRNLLGKTDVAALCQSALKQAYGDERSVHKAIAEDSGASPKAAENWTAGDNPMGLTAFLNAYHNNKVFKAWARKILLMEEDHDPEFQAQLAKFIQAAQRLSTGGDSA